MVSVVDFKSRAIERLDGYRDNPRCLPGLVYARYAAQPACRFRSQPAPFKKFALRTHKQHQMHLQHRNTCISVLGLLLQRLDMITREIVFVAPKYGIRRPLYVAEIARLTNLCSRTVKRCLGSLVRSRYLVRVENRMFLSIALFRDLKLDISYTRLANQLVGLAKKKATGMKQGGKALPGNQPRKAPSVPASHPQPIDDLSPPSNPTGRNEAIQNIHMASIRRMLLRKNRQPPDPDSSG